MVQVVITLLCAWTMGAVNPALCAPPTAGEVSPRYTVWAPSVSASSAAQASQPVSPLPPPSPLPTPEADND